MPRPIKDIVWKHCIKMNKSAKCKYCNKIYAFANVNKLEKHLQKCCKCPLTVKDQLKKVLTEQSKTQQNIENTENLQPQPSTSSYPESTSGPQSCITKERKKYLDLLLAKAIFVAGAPMSMVEHPLWVNFFEELQPLYKPPSRKVIATTHLESIYKEMQKEISEELNSASNLSF